MSSTLILSLRFSNFLYNLLASSDSESLKFLVKPIFQHRVPIEMLHVSAPDAFLCANWVYRSLKFSFKAPYSHHSCNRDLVLCPFPILNAVNPDTSFDPKPLIKISHTAVSLLFFTYLAAQLHLLYSIICFNNIFLCCCALYCKFTSPFKAKFYFRRLLIASLPSLLYVQQY